MNVITVSLLLLLSIISFINVSESYKILGVFPMPAHSHYSLGFRLMKELADKGHQVTFINPYPQKSPIKNYRDISVAELIEIVDEFKKSLFDFGKRSLLDGMRFMTTMGEIVSETTLKNDNVQKLLQSNEEFDLVIVEHFLDEALMGLAYHFKAPLIMLSPMPLSIYNNHWFSNPTHSAYVPNTLMETSKPMNFWQRTKNLLLDIMQLLIYQFDGLPVQRTIFKKYFNNNSYKQSLELDDIIYNASLLLVNSHISVTSSVPKVPNIIEIGGYHVNPPKKLPSDLQKFLDESKDGVVLFSMGSNLKSSDLKPNVRNALLKAFATIKQRVLWKFELDDLPGLPENVKIMKWLPQQDVLAHPNVQAFISHGGLLSNIETIYYGVPVIGIPVFGDQKNNVALAVAKGYAVNVPLDELTADKLGAALNEVLNNPRYKKTAKRLSKLMHDQPLTPIESAIYWVEYVIRHNGAPELRSAGSLLRWYQQNMLDIAIVLTIFSVALFIIFYLIIRKLLGLCRSKNVSKSKKNK